MDSIAFSRSVISRAARPLPMDGVEVRRGGHHPLMCHSISGSYAAKTRREIPRWWASMTPRTSSTFSLDLAPRYPVHAASGMARSLTSSAFAPEEHRGSTASCQASRLLEGKRSRRGREGLPAIGRDRPMKARRSAQTNDVGAPATA
jgi:hypothetical protein